VDTGETLLEAVKREIHEELGMTDSITEDQTPFLLTTTSINNSAMPCKTHFDAWYLVLTDGSNFVIDPTEFHDSKWVTIDEARTLITDASNRKALEVVAAM
jgi:8-oxo-dGTP pyrophosphatase MutT (NUDIX family)